MKKLSRFLKFVATGAFAFILSACYGMPAPMYGAPLALKVRAKDGSGASIPGIRVSFLRYGAAAETLGLTGADGAIDVVCDLAVGDTIRLEDVDGEANGAFKPKDAFVPDSADELDVVLDPEA
jgi:hypothetical protein